MAQGKLKTAKASMEKVENLPLTVSYANDKIIEASDGTPSRRNRAATIVRTDRFKNIRDGLSPFSRGLGKYGDSKVSITEAVHLCQMAHYNFPIFRNTIELMVEFSVNNIHFKGGNSKSRSFFKALFDKLGIWSIQDRVYREFYRSGNIFLMRLDGKVKDSDISKITQTFGTESKASVSLPLQYIVINPIDIHFVAGATFIGGVYQQLLSDFQLAALKNPKTEQDKALFKALPQETQDQINSNSTSVSIPLDPKYIYAIFYKKQDYEPFAVPAFYGVLADISWKEELKKCDMAIARTVQQAVLLVTSGAEPDKGGVNPKALQAIQTLFANESVGRVLVADYTTDAKFVIPVIGDLLDPKKYEIVDKDILAGLHNILAGDGKFSNESIKLQTFVERLKQARQAFINDFLLPEIKRISEDLGFKNFPTPYYEEFDLKNELEYAKIYTRLMELGILTPEEGIEAIETGILPEAEDSLASQTKLKQYHKDELYMPLATFGQKDAAGAAAGRPSGTKAPQTTKKMTPIGGSIESTESIYSVTKMKDIVAKVAKLTEAVKSQLLTSYNVKELSEDQDILAEEAVDVIISNEEPKNWLKSVKAYIKSPVDKNPKKVDEILSLAAHHGLDEFSASLLHHAKI